MLLGKYLHPNFESVPETKISKTPISQIDRTFNISDNVPNIEVFGAFFIFSPRSFFTRVSQITLGLIGRFSRPRLCHTVDSNRSPGLD